MATVEQLRTVMEGVGVREIVNAFKTVKRGTFGFNYAKDERTNTKEKLIDYVANFCENEGWTGQMIHALTNGNAVEFGGDDEADGEGEGGADASSAESGVKSTGQAKQKQKDNDSMSSNKLIEAIREAVGDNVDEDRVREIAQDVFDTSIKEVAGTFKPRVKEIVVKNPETGEVKQIGVSHKQFPDLLSACQARDHEGNRLNVWLTGPAGSGKTTAAKKVAEALSLDFYFTGAIDTEYKLLGFIDAHGKLISKSFRKAYEGGGVFLFDEVDSSMPGAVLAFNAALANGECDFPDGMVKRHKDFVCIAAANTWGLGATNDYVGRMKQDLAFVDRFVQIDWTYDEDLERAIAPNVDWCEKVIKFRKAASKMGMRVLITPRATLFGASLLAAGMKEDKVIEMTVKKSMTAEQWKSIKEAA